VTRRRDIDRHMQGLGEIQEILGAMRNLALLETRKLTRALVDQQQVTKTIRAAIFEAVASLPEPVAAPDVADEILIVLGSERGFCGDFNRALLEKLHDVPGSGTAPVIVVGQRLAARLPRSIAPVVVLAGASTTEEIAEVIVRVMREVGRWEESREAQLSLRPVVLHRQRSGDVARTVLDPLNEAAAEPHTARQPARTYLAPKTLLEKLTEHYLYAVLHQVFYGSLMAENEQRMLHMDSALRRLGEQTEDLRRRRNALRQEEITEEIEVMTLTTSLQAG
jgi:F-type H+-transporting ATPase subunit gamma